MERITITIYKDAVQEEVAKATDYTGSKLIDGDEGARDRILASDADLATLGRFWDETVMAANENFKEMLVSGQTLTTSGKSAYVAEIEVSKSFDKALTESVQTTMQSFFIASIIGQWFKFANKGEAGDYFGQAAEMLSSAERLLYSRKKPSLPTD